MARQDEADMIRARDDADIAGHVVTGRDESASALSSPIIAEAVAAFILATR